MSEGVVATPPNSADAEKQVLTIICRNPGLACVAVRMLAPDRFYTPVYSAWFKLLGDMEREGKMIDSVSVTERAIKAKLLDKIGGPSSIAEMFFPANEPAPEHLSFYCDVVNEKATRRDIIKACAEAGKIVAEGQDTAKAIQVLETAAVDARATHSSESERAVEHISDVLPRVVDGMAELYDIISAGGFPGIKTGFHGLDRQTGGWRAGRHYIFAARPGVGKTSIILDFILSLITRDPPVPVIFFSLEMTSVECVNRLVSKMARVNFHELNYRVPTKSELARMMTATDRLRHCPMLIDDSSGLTVTQIRQRTKDAMRSHSIKVVASDYIQIIKGIREYGHGEKRIEIGDVSQGLTDIGKDFNLPMISLAQLSRDATGKAQLGMESLKESGKLEEDAYFIGLLDRPYRDEDYDEPCERATIMIPKNRGGPTGLLEMTFQKSTMTWRDRTTEDQEEYTK